MGIGDWGLGIGLDRNLGGRYYCCNARDARPFHGMKPGSNTLRSSWMYFYDTIKEVYLSRYLPILVDASFRGPTFFYRQVMLEMVSLQQNLTRLIPWTITDMMMMRWDPWYMLNLDRSTSTVPYLQQWTNDLTPYETIADTLCDSIFNDYNYVGTHFYWLLKGKSIFGADANPWKKKDEPDSTETQRKINRIDNLKDYWMHFIKNSEFRYRNPPSMNNLISQILTRPRDSVTLSFNPGILTNARIDPWTIQKFKIFEAMTQVSLNGFSAYSRLHMTRYLSDVGATIGDDIFFYTANRDGQEHDSYSDDYASAKSRDVDSILSGSMILDLDEGIFYSN